MIPETFIQLGPGAALAGFIEKAGYSRLTPADMGTLQSFNSFRSRGLVPELVSIWGFLNFWPEVKQWCIQHGIRVTHGELGWFPHYESFALDPEGFCWESMLAKQEHLHGMESLEHPQVQRILARPPIQRILPPSIKPPFALWACQLVTDKVNLFGKNFPDWCGLVSHFRSILPEEIQLVVRPHPKMAQRRSREEKPYEALVQVVRNLPNTIMESQGDLGSLMSHSICVAGANSTVLTEARLRYRKPAYAYSPAWYSSNPELVIPLETGRKTQLDLKEDQSRVDRCKSSLWYCNQLLTRQINRQPEPDKEEIRRWVDRHAAVPGQAIPRQVHFVWFGGDPPPLYVANLADFRRLNPDIPCKLWQGVPDDCPSEVRDAMARCLTIQQQTDIFRGWLLSRYGGVFLDLDIAFIRPLPDSMFLQGAFTGSNHRTPRENGMMGCRKDDPEMVGYLKAMVESPPSKEFLALGPWMLRHLAAQGKWHFRPLPWWWFNICRCDPQQYTALIPMSLKQRQEATTEKPPAKWLAPYEGPTWDDQLPIGQHLHGSTHHQYRQNKEQSS